MISEDIGQGRIDRLIKELDVPEDGMAEDHIITLIGELRRSISAQEALLCELERMATVRWRVSQYAPVTRSAFFTR